LNYFVGVDAFAHRLKVTGIAASNVENANPFMVGNILKQEILEHDCPHGVFELVIRLPEPFDVMLMGIRLE
jgi:hypothetical protein